MLRRERDCERIFYECVVGVVVVAVLDIVVVVVVVDNDDILFDRLH